MIEKLREEILLRKGKRNYLLNQIEQVKKNIDDINKKIAISKESVKIIQNVAIETQSRIEFHISNIITTCIRNLGKDYKFVCKFVIRREKTECDLYLENSDGATLDPYSEVGGSIVQIIDFALRCSLWSLQREKVNNFLFLDEPFSGVKKTLHKKLSNILKEVSNKLNLQLIIITHDDELAKLGDNVVDLNYLLGGYNEQ